MRVNQGDAHSFETPGFSGKIVIWIRGLSIESTSKDMFKDKKRQSWFTVQGRFKHPLCMAEYVPTACYANHDFGAVIVAILNDK